jgi:2-keto-4-pentenoate hydratase
LSSPSNSPDPSAAQWKRAADVLWELWQAGRRIAGLPDDLRPATRQDGYAVQALLEDRSSAPLFGWKIAATSAAGQRHINVDGPLAGRLLREKAFGSGAELPFGANHMRVAEAEFAFVMEEDLPPRPDAYSVAEVLAAVGALHPAIEIPDSRYEDFTTVGAAQLIADNACAHLFVLGSPAPRDWRDVDLVAHRVLGAVVGSVAREGTGANVLGDPRVALMWLANELSGLGIPLRAGQVVTTGTCLTPLPITPGAHIVMDFGRFGVVSATVTDRVA